MTERALFEARVLPHLDAMLRAAAALVGATEAEDVVQEALVRAWRAWFSLRDADAVRKHNRSERATTQVLLPRIAGQEQNHHA